MSAHTDRMIIFDDGLGQLGAMTDLRASFEVRTGMYTTAGRIRAARPRTLVGYWVPEALRAVVASRADAVVNLLPNEEVLLCVNGRWAMPDPDLRLAVGEALVEETTGHVVAASLRRADAEYFLMTSQLHERARVRRLHQRVLYRHPWEVLALLEETVPHDIHSMHLLDARVPSDVADVIGPYPVEVHASVEIGPGVVFDAAHGPIMVHEGAVIRPHAILCGPCSIGPGSTVIDRAVLKPNVAVGPVSKIGGEVGSTIFQGYANKSHDGHLGDSWVGKWVNLGAGTTSSNLLNTYGEVSMRVEPDGPRHRTGRTFLGAVFGDHVKTAISTRVMTGSHLGTGAMISLSTPPPTTVRRFAWLTDEGERVFRLDRFLEVMRAMMARRGKNPSEAYIELVCALHESAAGSRVGRLGAGGG